jgi:enoyl-CoA hydratase/carnithine racemase
MLTGEELERAGLVSKVVENDALMPEAMAVANKIASYSLPSSKNTYLLVSCGRPIDQ